MIIQRDGAPRPQHRDSTGFCATGRRLTSIDRQPDIIDRQQTPIAKESSMRSIRESARSSILNQAITIFAEEPKGVGARYRYSIRVSPSGQADAAILINEVRFQHGPVGRDGSNINGISDESLIEILIDRLVAFQDGPWASEANARALSHLRGALSAMEDRTFQRRAGGVEGTTQFVPGERGFGDEPERDL